MTVHGCFGLALLQSHHRPRKGPFEVNDVFAIINAIPAIALLAFGFSNKGLIPGLCFGAVSFLLSTTCFFTVGHPIQARWHGDILLAPFFNYLIFFFFFTNYLMLKTGSRNHSVWDGLHVCAWWTRPPSISSRAHRKCPLFTKSCCSSPSIIFFSFLFFLSNYPSNHIHLSKSIAFLLKFDLCSVCFDVK